MEKGVPRGKKKSPHTSKPTPPMAAAPMGRGKWGTTLTETPQLQGGLLTVAPPVQRRGPGPCGPTGEDAQTPTHSKVGEESGVSGGQHCPNTQTLPPHPGPVYSSSEGE